MNNLPQIFCAVDTPDIQRALEIVTDIRETCGIKLGLEFFNANGVEGLKIIAAAAPDLPVFVDLKYHDIPNTVAGAIRALTADFTPAFLNVHAAGGLDMMRAAKAACPTGTKLLAVTVLTSLDSDNLKHIGQDNDPKSQVARLAKLTQQAGLDGVVCSSHEIETIRNTCGDDFITMVPGIRPIGSDKGDQKRVMTPREAINKGATHLVIGRPITGAENSSKAAQDIIDTLA